MAEPPIIAAQPAPAPKKSSGDKPPASTAPDLPALEGKTAIDEKLTLECELLSYRSASTVAGAVARELLDRLPDGELTVVLIEEPDHAALHLRQAFVLQVQWIENAFIRAQALLDGAASEEDEVPPPEEESRESTEKSRRKIVHMGGMAALAAAAAPVLDLVGLFRQDVTYSGRQTKVSQKAFLLEVARHLMARPKERTVVVTYPRLALFALRTEEPASHTLIRGRLDPLLAIRAELEARLADLAREVARREQAVSDRLKAAGARKDGEAAALESEVQDVLALRLRVAAARRLFETTEAQLSAMWTGLLTPDAKTGRTGLQSLHEAEELRARFKDKPNAVLLHAEVVAAGGSYKVVRNLWRTLFWGDGLRYSGGVVVTYVAFDGAANIVISGTHRYLEPHLRFEPAWRAVRTINSIDAGPDPPRQAG